ncbi:MAG: VacJ family lipoprotein [Thermodesulfobacteriota bacterium]|nr:VacJ family lipoprotein [Thermodesulfobacteriota bacterium]
MFYRRLLSIWFLVITGALSLAAEIPEASVVSQENRPFWVCQVETSEEMEGVSDEWWDQEADLDLISDPLEPVNRVFFGFNDKLYFWAIKPAATGYEKVVPQVLRISVRNFLSNLGMPIRAVNCLLQGKISGFGREIARFLVNSTVGVAGFGDPARKAFDIDGKNEDFGQTLGFFGLGPGIYVCWPVLGPSSLRGTVGMVGDGFLNPLNYIVDPTKYNLAIKGYGRINNTSLRLGEYESLKRAALDPYVAIRDAYHEYRQNKIKE